MATSSTSLIQKKFKYNVFLSFCGDDSRKTFLGHLYADLQRRGIRTFKDDEELRQGERIDDQLMESIEDSKFFIIILSKKYASSSWCLKELVKIIECHRTTYQTAFPVFYHVDPSEIRSQTGEVGEAFAKHNNKKEVGKWREALNETGNLTGWDLKSFDGYEDQLIETIAEHLSRELRSINVYNDAKIVGMEPRVEKVLSLLETGIDDVRMIGIKGIGGGGKTTLAKAVFDRISTQFKGTSFVQDVRKLGLKSSQQQLLSEVLNKDIKVNGVLHGKNLMASMLWVTKALVVLDNVDCLDQLQALAELEWFASGSRIIVTTRDEQVLISHGVTQYLEVDLLSNAEAMCLFNKYAFANKIPKAYKKLYKKLSHECVRYAARLPLTIKVLGSSLCGKELEFWEAELKRLDKYPLEETLNILEWSYGGLKADVKDIFLDVACFLKWSLKDDAVRILESCGFEAKIGLKDLEQKSLITISDDQFVGMHDQIQEMGRHIVRRSHPNDPKKHSRLWIYMDVENILADDLGTDKTNAIAVDDNHVEFNSAIVTKGFGSMKKLRFLRLVSEREEKDDDDNVDDGRRHKKIDHASHNFPRELKYLSWKCYPHWSLPEKFEAIHLVALEMSGCRMEQLWGGEQRKVLQKLKFLVLCKSNLKTLDLGLMPNLEELDVEGCSDLKQVHTPILKTLVSLNLSGCKKIKSFSFITRLESLKVLCLSDLFLKKFPDIVPGHCNNTLLQLQFRHNDIKELPSSIGNLQELVDLDLHFCAKLRSLPKSICGLRQLKNLKLTCCPLLKGLPESIRQLECLETLSLSSAVIEHLPDSICKLKRLKALNLSHCFNLEKLPEELGQLESLQELILTECARVKDIPDSVSRLEHMKYLCLRGCVQLEKLPQELGLSGCLAELNIEGTGIRQLPPHISSSQHVKVITGAKLVKNGMVLHPPRGRRVH